MHLGFIAAGLVMGLVGQPSKSIERHYTPAHRYYHWVVVPGGGVCPIATPFVFFVPISKFDPITLAKGTKSRQELHIVIETDSVAKTESFAKKIVESVRHIVEDTSTIESTEAEFATAKALECKGTSKSDPKQVIDPVVTGF